MYKKQIIMSAYIFVSACSLNTVIAEDTKGWETEVSAGINLTDGNSDTLLGNLGYATKNVTGANETTFSANYNYGETEKETTTDNASSALQYKRAVDVKWYGFGLASYLYDDIAMVDHRVIIGPGMGYRVTDNATTRLNVELGVVWITEDVADVSNDYVAIRAAQTYERHLNDNAKIWESLELLPDIEDSENFIVNATIGIDSKIADGLSLRVALNNRFDNAPGEGLDDNDLQVTGGLVLKL